MKPRLVPSSTNFKLPVCYFEGLGNGAYLPRTKFSKVKKSWAVELENQDEMRKYVAEFMELLGDTNINPEPERKFHISLANLTGNPQDSVR